MRVQKRSLSHQQPLPRVVVLLTVLFLGLSAGGLRGQQGTAVDFDKLIQKSDALLEDALRGHQATQSILFVFGDETTVFRDVRGKDGGDFAFHA